MTVAVGRLSDAASGEELGTVFAVTDRLALTAFHCIGNRDTGKVKHRRLECRWLNGSSNAVVRDGDRLLDVALLRLEHTLPPDLDAIPLVHEAREHTPFIAPGAVRAVNDVFTFAASGEITWTDGRLEDDGAPVIQLTCRESAAELSLHGLSGAPVLIGRPHAAAAVIRWNSPREDRPDIAAGAAVYATPARAVVRLWPQLDREDQARASAHTVLARRLSDRNLRRTRATLRSEVMQLLLHGDLDIDEHDLDVPANPADHGLVVIDRGRALVEVVTDLRTTRTSRIAEGRLSTHVRERSNETGQRYVGLLTDGAEWRLYQHIDDQFSLAASTHIDPAVSSAEALLSWIEAIVSTRQQIVPIPDEIKRTLGATSPAHILDAAELTAIYARHRHWPTVQVKRRMWAKLLTTALGTNFTDDDALFVDHTLLAAIAKLIGHAVIGYELGGRDIDAATIMSGSLFSDADIGGVIEPDFFDWIVEVPDGERFIKGLARRLARFAWNDVDHDVMKVLYESIIPQQTRHRLGEYYTPDWLAEYIVDESTENTLADRVLDPSCGSGTFLFHAVRRYLKAAQDSGASTAEGIRGVVRHVIGIDVHPVAVTLARITYLLAIGSRSLRAENRPAFAVPVYLGDSLRWGQESTLLSYDGLSVSTTLSHESFVNDPMAVESLDFSNRLLFPSQVVDDAERFDLLVADLANLATQRDRGSAIPSLRGVFRRFEIPDAESSTIERTFALMCSLHDQDKDHIWGYYVRNLARPAWLTRPDHRVDLLVGNPPWLAYRYMTSAQQRSFRAMSLERGLWAGATVATNQDLSALFVARCIELYLRPGGRFGCVMPQGVLSRRQHDGFRSGSFPVHAEPVKVAFGQPWDLHMLKPSFFPLPACVIFGRRQTADAAPIRLDKVPQVWSGRFDTKAATRAEANGHLSRLSGEPPPPTVSVSPYAAQFVQGATVVPRLLFIVEPDRDGLLGSGAGKRSIRSRRSPYEKHPWKELPSLHGRVEREFVRPLYVGDSILPFRRKTPAEAVVPWDGQRLLHGDCDQLTFYRGLAAWWRTAESAWNEYRSSDRLTLIEQLDYRNKLSQQFPISKHRVVYSASGMYLAAALISDPNAVIEHKLYWAPMETADEAHFLIAVLNSTILTTTVRPLQARGEHNPRDFDKYVFQAAIPSYDPQDSAHRELVALAERAERVAATVDLPSVRFETQRRWVRDALADDGVAADIDAIVKALLSSPLRASKRRGVRPRSG